jgi:hypothetical protein
VRSSLVLAVVLIVLPGSYCLAQDDTTPKAPRLIIKLPDNIAPESVWINYLVDRRISGTSLPGLQSNSREFVILCVRNSEGKPENTKVVMYSRGCEFKTYDLDLVGDADVEKRFRCDPLPTHTLHGFIPPGELPSTIYKQVEKRIDIVGKLEADWMFSFFTQPTQGGFAGSILGGFSVPLGVIGTIDPDEQGKFEITIPDFTRDPIFAKWKTQFGVIETGLRDKKVGASLGTIKPKDTSSRPGLNVQADYPDPVVFTKSH